MGYYHMIYRQNLVHGEGTSLSRVGPYQFCSGGTLYKPSWWYRFGYRFRVSPYRFCGNGNPTTLSTPLCSYLVLSDTHISWWSPDFWTINSMTEILPCPRPFGVTSTDIMHYDLRLAITKLVPAVSAIQGNLWSAGVETLRSFILYCLWIPNLNGCQPKLNKHPSPPCNNSLGIPPFWGQPFDHGTVFFWLGVVSPAHSSSVPTWDFFMLGDR